MDGTVFITAMIIICVDAAAIMLLARPIRGLLRFLAGAVLGMAAVYALNVFFPAVNVGINPVTAAVTGFLGLPGVAALIVAGLLL